MRNSDEQAFYNHHYYQSLETLKSLYCESVRSSLRLHSWCENLTKFVLYSLNVNHYKIFGQYNCIIVFMLYVVLLQK